MALTHDAPASGNATEPAGRPRRRPRLGYAQVLAGAILFGFNAPVSKVVLGAGIEPARLAALRATGAALGLFGVLAVASPSRLRVSWRHLPALAVLGLTATALIQWLYFVAIDRLPVGIALLLEFTGPLMVAVWSHVVLRQRQPRQVRLALGLTLAGLALAAQVWRDAGLDPVGAAGLGAGACLATFYLLGQHTIDDLDPITTSFWMLVFAAAFWAVAQPWWSFDFGVLTQRTSLLGAADGVLVPVWLPLAWVVVLGTMAPYALEVTALRHLAATTCGVVATIEPVVAAAAAWLWLDEVLSTTQVIGGAVVLCGVAVVEGAARCARRRPLPEPVAPGVA